MNIQDLLEQNGVSIRTADHHHVRKGWVGVDCPYCSPRSERYRAAYNLKTGRASCWNCGRRDPIDLLSKLLRCDRKKAASLLSNVRFYFSKDKRRDHSGVLKKPKGIGSLSQNQIQYLKKRGFDSDEIQSIWNVKGFGPVGKMAWRLFIPIYNQFGREVSWTTRAIGPAKARYISASTEEEEWPHKQLLYGHHLLAGHTAIVVEGPLDAWAIGPGAVATLGVGCTDFQIELIATIPNRVILFDSSADAQKRSERLCSDLSTMPGSTTSVFLETGDDPAEADPEEIAEIRAAFL